MTNWNLDGETKTKDVYDDLLDTDGDDDYSNFEGFYLCMLVSYILHSVMRNNF